MFQSLNFTLSQFRFNSAMFTRCVYACCSFGRFKGIGCEHSDRTIKTFFFLVSPSSNLFAFVTLASTEFQVVLVKLVKKISLFMFSLFLLFNFTQLTCSKKTVSYSYHQKHPLIPNFSARTMLPKLFFTRSKLMF